ncbi:MAG: helix-turn-helix domain-containing protein [Sphaerochaeta sp.]|nr:helix-turn-helix domain-containing protein [Sphaerochaeta sp.]
MGKMQFNEKLRSARLASGLTQEQLAEKVFVSRVTVSKWETGRGYPNLDSLKQLSRLFGISLDELLGSDELVSIAEAEVKTGAEKDRTLMFGLLDCLGLLLLFIPMFAVARDERIVLIALLEFHTPSDWILKTMVACLFLFGCTELALQNLRAPFWQRWNPLSSFLLSFFATLLFIAARQPYPGVFMLFLLVAKGIYVIRRR